MLNPTEAIVPEKIRYIDYYYASVQDKPGAAARALGALQQEGINLLGISASPPWCAQIPTGSRPRRPGRLKKRGQKAGLELSKKKIGFLIQGEDRTGAIAEIAEEPQAGECQYHFSATFSAGLGRYGGMLWVKPPDLRKAAKVLGVSRSSVATTGDVVDEASQESFPASDTPSWTPGHS